MKNLLKLSGLFLIVFTALFITSCETDPIDDPALKPNLTLNSSADITLAPSEEFTISVSGTAGDNPLKAVTVYENGTKIAEDRFSVDGTPASSNAILLVGDLTTSFTWNIGVKAQAEASTTVDYSVEVIDDANNTAAVTVSVTTVGVPPSFTTTSPTMVTGLEQDIKNGFKLTATKGSGKLATIEVLENDMKLDPSRIFWKVISMSVAANPFAIEGADQDGFENADLYIMTPMSEGAFTYKVILTDEFGLTSQLEFMITTKANGTPVDVINGIIWNRSGPNMGGFDFSGGVTVSSMSTLADIRDKGNISTTDQTWLKQFEAVNGATIRRVVKGMGGISESFTFDSVEFKEDLKDLYDGSQTYNSETIVKSDMYTVVDSEGNYFLFRVTDIVETNSDNLDNYVIDVVR